MFRIASFNVNSVRSRLHILERWLPFSSPDLLFMQETKVVNDLFPVQNFNDLGYEVYFNGEKSYNGVALAAKKILINKISNINFGFNDNITPNFETRVMTLEFNNIYILHTYVPQGKLISHPDYILKQEFFKRVKKIIEQKINDKFISSFIDFNEYESIVPDEIVHVNMLIQSNMYAVLLMFKYGWKFDSYHDIYSIINYNIYIGLDRLRLTGDETFCIHFFNYKLLDEMQQVINTMSAYFAEDLFNVITKLQTKDIENEVWW